MRRRGAWLPWLLMLAVGLASCGAGREGREAAASGSPSASPSAGQVGAPKSYKVGFHAASRFADQATFGPTPALVEEIRSKGFEAWIDEQFALPPAPLDNARIVANWADDSSATIELSRPIFRGELMRKFLSAPDQLRWRVMLALHQYIVISAVRVETGALSYWANDLYRLAFDNYANLIRDVSTSAPMGFYLDNAQNRPKSAECPWCAPNENYARELMQLFTLGVVRLEADGTVVRDNRGRPLETYTQRDVDELARVLTGWTYDPVRVPDTRRNWGNWPKRMVPSPWAPDRDSGAKTVLGHTFPAGQSHQKDLEDMIRMLMQHPNIAPFVALRLIQNLVKSDPSPAYIARVGAAFRDDGRGVAGDMKATIKAVLLDPEARRGDEPALAHARDGKLREPILRTTGLLRGLDCTQAPMEWWSGRPMTASMQEPFYQSSVFGFYAPTDRAPGSNLLAPEQKLINQAEFFQRLWQLNYMVGVFNGQPERGRQALADAGCQLDRFMQAYRNGIAPLAELISQRYLRGVQPAQLVTTLKSIEAQWRLAARMDESEVVTKLIEFALVTDAYGALR